jgi:hypothetical protein
VTQLEQRRAHRSSNTDTSSEPSRATGSKDFFSRLGKNTGRQRKILFSEIPEIPAKIGQTKFHIGT